MDLELSIPHLYVPRSESWESWFITTSFNKFTEYRMFMLESTIGLRGLAV